MKKITEAVKLLGKGFYATGMDKYDLDADKPIITPKEAAKLAKKAVVTPTSYRDCLKDIKLRAERGYTWTMMLQVKEDVIMELKEAGWKVIVQNRNQYTSTFLIKIEW